MGQEDVDPASGESERQQASHRQAQNHGTQKSHPPKSTSLANPDQEARPFVDSETVFVRKASLPHRGQLSAGKDPTAGARTRAQGAAQKTLPGRQTREGHGGTHQVFEVTHGENHDR